MAILTGFPPSSQVSGWGFSSSNLISGGRFSPSTIGAGGIIHPTTTITARGRSSTVLNTFLRSDNDLRDLLVTMSNAIPDWEDNPRLVVYRTMLQELTGDHYAIFYIDENGKERCEDHHLEDARLPVNEAWDYKSIKEIQPGKDRLMQSVATVVGRQITAVVKLKPGQTITDGCGKIINDPREDRQ